jgi:hypothetical protein
MITLAGKRVPVKDDVVVVHEGCESVDGVFTRPNKGDVLAIVIT